MMPRIYRNQTVECYDVQVTDQIVYNARIQKCDDSKCPCAHSIDIVPSRNTLDKTVTLSWAQLKAVKALFDQGYIDLRSATGVLLDAKEESRVTR